MFQSPTIECSPLKDTLLPNIFVASALSVSVGALSLPQVASLSSHPFSENISVFSEHMDKGLRHSKDVHLDTEASATSLGGHGPLHDHNDITSVGNTIHIS